MLESGSDHYRVLGVARDAAEQDIKKAYFKLVRRHPPESAPEEFKRVRKAYEVLSDPVERKKFDAQGESREEVGARVRAGAAALERGDHKLAQAELRHALVLEPTHAGARDLLGTAYLHAGQAREAASQFDRLVRDRPDHAPYFVHLGAAYVALQQYPQAFTAYRRAVELDPSDRRARMALADCYLANNQHEQALAELDAAFQLGGRFAKPGSTAAGPSDARPPGPGGLDGEELDLVIRKVRIQLLRARVDLADAVLDATLDRLPDTVEARGALATRLAALSADLFRIHRSDDANHLLERAQRLESKARGAGTYFPTRVTVALRDLPAASLARLKKLRRESSPSRIVNGGWAAPVLLAAAAVATGMGAWGSSFTTTARWEGESHLMPFLLLLAAPVLLAMAARAIYRVVASPVGNYTVVHPLYLLRVQLDEMTVWPLVNLAGIALTHHVQNGIYRHTSVRMNFNGEPLSITIRGEQAAMEWAQHALEARDRVLGLMGIGALDEDNLDLIPAAQLAGASAIGRARRQQRRRLAYAACGLAGGLVFFGVAVPFNRGVAERAAWQTIERQLLANVDDYDGDALLRACRGYLVQFPAGDRVGEVRAAMRADYDHARQAYVARAGRAPAAATVAAIFDAVRDGDQPRSPWELEYARIPIGVRFRHQVSSEIARSSAPPNRDPLSGVPVIIGRGSAPPPASDGDEEDGAASPVDAAEAFTGTEAADREGEFTRTLDQALNQGLPRQVLRMAPVARRGRVATVTVDYRVAPTGELWTLGNGSSYHGLHFDFSVTISIGDEERHRLRAYFNERLSDLDVAYLQELPSDESRIGPYQHLADRAFHEFGAMLASELGVAWPSPHEAAEGGAQVGAPGAGDPRVRSLLDALLRQQVPPSPDEAR